MTTDLERLLNLLRRELGAADARFLSSEESAGGDERCLSCRLADGRGVEVRFETSPPDREAKQLRLEMLAATFDTALEEGPAGLGARRSRPPVSISLHDELVAVCERIGAVNALVIDANSPVVWGAAFPEGVVALPPLASSPRVADAPANDEALGEGSPAAMSRRAVHVVRGWPELGALRKGKHLRKIERDERPAGGTTALLAHSFASIYVLLLVFGAPFDELRAERGILEALPRIERLVLALPPLDPDPSEKAGAIAVRRPRRP